MYTNRLLFIFSLFLSFFSLTSLWAQTGPGGVGNSTTNKLWLKADAGVANPTANASVPLWADQSGNGWNARQTNETNQPTLLPNGLNGKPVLHFDRSIATQYLDINSSGIGGVMSNSNSLFAVAKTTSASLDATTNYSQCIITTSSTSFTGMRLMATSGSTQVTMLAFDQTLANNTNSSVYNSSGITKDQWYLGSHVIQEVGTNTTITGYTNGLLTGSKSQAFAMQNSGDLVRVGARTPSGDWSSPFNGDIAEIIAYNTPLNETQRTLVENYLSSKYAIAIANDYYAFDATGQYGNEVAGIGRLNATSQHLTASSSLLTLGSSSLQDGQYLLVGHNGGTLSLTNSDAPAGSKRLGRVWRADWAASSPAVSLAFNVAGFNLPAGSQFRLLVDDNGTFHDGTAYEGTLSNGVFTITASLALPDGAYLTLAVTSNGASAPVSLRYEPATVTLVYGTAFTSPLPLVDNGGSVITGYSFSPAAPAGISINASTGALQVTSGLAVGTYTLGIQASNALGSTVFSQVFVVKVTQYQATLLYYPPQTVSLGNALTPIYPNLPQGGYQYSLTSGSLGGLVLNASTGEISGTLAAEGTVTATLRATATGANGTGTVSSNVSFTALGATGPAGVGSALSNKVWLDASYQTRYGHNSRVGTVIDRSGNGWNARQTNGNYQPSYLTNALNSKPVLHFDRTSAPQYLEVTNVGMGAVMSATNTLFAVAKANSGAATATTNANQTIVMAPGNHSGLMFAGFPTVINMSYAQVTNDNVYISLFTPITQGNWYLTSRRVSETTRGTTMDGLLNGALNVSKARIQQMYNHPDALRLGAMGPSGDYIFPLNGDIAEVLLFNTQLNNAQQTLVDNYLGAKYNLTISNDYYTGNDATYHLDVIGIGTTDGSNAHKHSKAAGTGLLLAESNASLNAAGEFLLAGHASPANNLVAADLTGAIQQRWQRNWYVEKSVSSTVEAKVAFDWSEGGFPPGIELAGNLSHYRLLYRATATGTFTALALSPTLENGDQIAFLVGNENLASGYYTLGIDAPAVATPVLSATGSTTVCQGNSVPLGIAPVAGASYQWLLNEALLPGVTTPTHAATLSGTYQVIVTLNGAFATSNPLSAFITQAPKLTLSPNASIHSGESASLTASGNAAGSALTFDGIDDCLSGGHPLTTSLINTFTVEAWVLPTATHRIDAQSGTGAVGTSSGALKYLIFPFPPPGSGTGHAGMGLSVGTNGISVYEHTSSNIPAVLVWQPAAGESLSGWTHIAVVYTNKVPSLYVNGELKKTGVSSANHPYVHPSVGLGGGAYGYYKGSVDELRIWSKARSQAEIRATMNTSLTVPTPDLAGYWPLDEGGGRQVRELVAGVVGTLTQYFIWTGTGWSNDIYTPALTTTSASWISSTVPLVPSFSWSPASSLSANTGASVTATPTETTTYTLTATAGSCTATAQVTVSLLEPATPPVPTVSYDACGEATLSISAAPVGVTYYLQTSAEGTSINRYCWSETPGQPCNFYIETSGTYYLRARSDAGGIWSNGTSAMNIIVTKGPTISIEPVEPDRNYVTTNTILREGIKGDTQLEALCAGFIQQQTTYLDGLGRPIQIVTTQASPSKKDIVQPIAYDEFGRQPVSYMPYTGEQNGLFKVDALGAQKTFYQNQIGIAHDNSPFTKTSFEASPFNQVLAQTATGDDWQSKPTQQITRTNVTADAIHQWNYDGELTYSKDYDASQLLVFQHTDEHGMKTSQFTTKTGQLVCKKVQLKAGEENYLETHYVYDELSLLRVVIQPAGMDYLSQLTSDNAGFIFRFCFIYNYDSHQRMITKQVSGADAIWMVYNSRNELILFQNGNQRASRQWNYNKYDALGRVVQTGLYTADASIESQAAMQEEVNAYELANDTDGTTYNPFFEERPLGVISYSNVAFPVSNTQIMTESYYDDYTFEGASTHLFVAESGYDSSADTDHLTGRLTGKKTYRLFAVNDPEAATLTNALYSLFYYDNRGRAIQSISDNHVGGQDVTSIKYNFVGKVLSSYSRHNNPQDQERQQLVVKITTDYDHLGRVHTTFQQVDEQVTSGWKHGNKERLAQLAYNELGQLMHKEQGEHPTYQGQPLQNVDYAYNIRGWLSSINAVALQSPTEDRLFGMALLYNRDLNGKALTNHQFNGNIAVQLWKSQLDSKARQYSYTYDGMNRIKRGVYSSENANENFTMTGVDANGDEMGIQYDKNGNILSLHQQGLTQRNGNNLTFDWVDKLSYSYGSEGGNQLKTVIDNVQVSTQSSSNPAGDFFDRSNGGDDFAYDANGNLTNDVNKRIQSIEYNYLNLPVQIVIEDESGISNTIYYRYTAGGTKLQKVVKEGNSASKTTDYIAGLIYEKNGQVLHQLQFVPSGEGRAIPPSLSGTGGWAYEYQYKDHLGDLRVSFRPGVSTLYNATMESDKATSEESTFSNLNNSIRTPDLCEGDKAVKLSQTHPMGPMRILKVRKGDVISASVRGWYTTPAASNNGTGLSLFISTYSGNVPGQNEGSPLGGWPSLQVGVAFTPRPAQLPSEAPTAYLQLIVYDDQQVRTEVKTCFVKSDNCEPLNHQLAVEEYKILQDGYVRIYLASESEGEVYFDDLSITHQEAMIVQENHYSPFGLNLAGIETQGQPDHKFQYNGKEKQEELGLNWIDYGARMYDPQLGRWHVVDRFSEKYYPMSPYSYAINNPINYIDINGDYVTLYGQDDSGNQYSVLYENGKTYHYTKDKNGNVQKGKEYDGKNSFIDQAASDLNSIASTDKGQKRVNDLTQSKYEYSIHEETVLERSRFTWEETEKGGGKINYYQKGGTLDYVSFNTSYFALGHEIQHAWDRDQAKDFYLTEKQNGLRLSEYNAVAFENYLRAMAGENIMRVNYTDIRVYENSSPEYFKKLADPLRKTEEYYLPSPYKPSSGVDNTYVVPNYKALRFDSRTGKYIDSTK